MIDETIAEIREMQTHSSSVVALKATRALGDLATREFATIDEFDRAVQQNAGALRRANPSHASLHNAMREISERVPGGAETVAGAKDLLEATVAEVVQRIETGKTAAARAAAETFADGETFLTHDYSSTVLEAVETALDERDLSLTAYVTEARPRYLGRKTARKLAARDRVEPHLLVDGAASRFLQECDRVLVGMDCIVDDTLYNRVGTYPLAVTADRMGVPVEVVGSATKLIEEGFRFENEQRPSYEVMLEPVEGVHLENPAYDATPVELLDGVITGEGRRDL
jgi:translation initiation factor eIF-2B subunit delta